MSGSRLDDPVFKMYEAQAIVVEKERELKEKDDEISRMQQEIKRLRMDSNQNQLELAHKMIKLEELVANQRRNQEELSQKVISEFSLNDFTEKEPIGKGGEGEVFRGYNGRLGKVAFKILNRLIDKTKMNEVILLVKHSNHPNIIRLFGLLTPEERYLPNNRSFCIGYIMECMESSLFDGLFGFFPYVERNNNFLLFE